MVARQHGAFHVNQAAREGIDRSKLSRLVQAGDLRHGLPSIYLVSGSPQTRKQFLHQVVLWAGEGCALSHTTSADLLGLDVDADGIVHLTTTRNLRPPTRLIRVHRIIHTEARDVSTVRGLPVMTMPRTVIDLASLLEEEPLDIALDSAIRRGMWRGTFVDRFAEFSDSRRRGIGMLGRLIAERETEQGLPGSAFERRLLRLLRKQGLPMPVCQYVFETQSVHARIDFAYPELGIALEADGYRWHDGRSSRIARVQVRTGGDPF
jgi:hypothetical protein